MKACFERHGGMASANELALALHALAVLSVRWHGETFVPLFQFERSDLAIRKVVCDVIEELRTPFDNWELALWFAQPNLWLGGAVPAELVTKDERAVLGAARADRFIALG